MESTGNTASSAEPTVSLPAFPWWIALVEGTFTLMLGIFLVTAPGATTAFVVTVLGFYLLIRGIFSIVEIFIGNTGTHWGWLLAMGILGIVAGLVVLRHPLYAAALTGSVAVIILAVDGLLIGIAGLARAFTGTGWGPAILGVLTIVISTFLFVNVWAVTLALPIIIGSFMIIAGIVGIVSSFYLRSA